MFNIFLFSLPLIFCLVFFLIGDPFGIFYVKDCLAEASEDVLVTREYLGAADREVPTAFIFGNSRVHGFRADDWQKCIGQERVMHFGAPGESVLNIRKKLEIILNRQGINRALILIDEGILENTDNSHRYYQGPVYNHSPSTSNISWPDFYASYIRYYFTDYFFAKHIYYTLTSDYRADWMESAFKNPHLKNRTFKSERYLNLADSLITTDFNMYKNVFHPDYSPFKKSIEKIHPDDSLHLVAIRKLLSEKKVDYVIVIPPDFNKQKIEPKIKNTLVTLFGNKLFDFTGNNRITRDSTLNFENLHFTSAAGRLILDSIYHAKTLSENTLPAGR